ncbi:MAG: hypothetical protein ABGX12_06305, partial [Desulfurobacteriaceae bacterium]
MLRFNFAEVKESKFAKYVRPDLLFLILVLLVVFSVSWAYQNSFKKQIRAVSQQIDTLNRERQRLNKIKKEEKRYKELKKELQLKLSVVSKLDKGRQVPSVLYFFSNPNNLNGIWLDQLSLRDGILNITGNAYTLDNLKEFLSKVETKLGE